MECVHCGRALAHKVKTGLCWTCFVKTGKIREFSGGGRPFKQEKQPVEAEFRSGLGELDEPMGWAISAPGPFWREQRYG